MCTTTSEACAYMDASCRRPSLTSTPSVRIEVVPTCPHPSRAPPPWARSRQPRCPSNRRRSHRRCRRWQLRPPTRSHAALCNKCAREARPVAGTWSICGGRRCPQPAHSRGPLRRKQSQCPTMRGTLGVLSMLRAAKGVARDRGKFRRECQTNALLARSYRDSGHADANVSSRAPLQIFAANSGVMHRVRARTHVLKQCND